VLEQLRENKASLFAAICVSPTWFHSGVGVLWREGRLHALRRLAPARLEFYADMIVRLDIYKDSLPDELPTLPRLRALSFNVSPMNPQFSRVLEFIGPSIEELCCVFDSRVAERVMALCCRGRLRRLDFSASNWNEYSYDLDPFIDWMALQSLPMLESFKLHHPSLGSGQLLERLLSCFARLEQLTNLGLTCWRRKPWPATLEVISSLAQSGDDSCLMGAIPTFSRLRSLSLGGVCEVVAVLAPLMPSLTSLVLGLHTAHRVFSAVASIATLEELRLTLSDDAILDGGDLLALRNLQHMRCFVLSTWNARRIGITDADIAQLVSSWRKLASFTFKPELSHSPKLLGLIGAACPRIADLEIQGTQCFDCAFDDAGHPTPLFPNLRSMFIGSLAANHDDCVRYGLSY
jgi:hypothetical protein